MSPWQELMTTLTNELPILDALMQVAERKRDAMLRDNLAEIDEVVTQEMTLLKRLQDEEERASRVLAQLKPLVKSDQLPDLIASPYCPCRGELEHIYQQMLTALAALKAINQQNQALVSQSQAYIALSVKVMMGIQKDQGYTAQGKQAQNNPNRRLDFRA